MSKKATAAKTMLGVIGEDVSLMGPSEMYAVLDELGYGYNSATGCWNRGTFCNAALIAAIDIADQVVVAVKVNDDDVTHFQVTKVEALTKAHEYPWEIEYRFSTSQAGLLVIG